MDAKPDKNLGQHWLKDAAVLEGIAAHANLTASDTVLEIGAGLGTLTAVLAAQAGRVVAVEFDVDLAEKLKTSLRAQRSNPANQSQSGSPRQMDLPRDDRIEIINADFLKFDLSSLPVGYKVVANIPYYITNKIIMKLLTAENKPSVAVLLVQKEVAERLAAEPGAMSVLSVAAQLYSEVCLGEIVPAKMFTPPPKVDSQVVILRPNKQPSLRAREPKPRTRSGGSNPALDRHGDKSPRDDVRERIFFRVVRAGFSERRKKLRSSLSGGLGISKTEAEKLLKRANIDPNLRAQDLSLENWQTLAETFKSTQR